MKTKYNWSSIVIYLHEKGFTNDFRMLNNELIWIQENISITTDDFLILECHRVTSNVSGKDHMLIFGILIFPYFEKGILSIPYQSPE